MFKAIDMETGEAVSIKYLKPVRKKKIRRERIRAVESPFERSRLCSSWRTDLALSLYGIACARDLQLLGMVMNPETHAPSIITKWVETKDFRVMVVSFDTH